MGLYDPKELYTRGTQARDTKTGKAGIVQDGPGIAGHVKIKFQGETHARHVHHTQLVPINLKGDD